MGGYLDLGCFAHTLQLIIHDSVFSQRSVTNTLAVCRSIVGHFKRSPLACSKLKEIQGNLSIPEHRLKQDVVTRWNSTLYMLKSVQEQKMALAAYSVENNIPQLTSNQLDLVNKLITLLTPVEEITQSISSDDSSASVIIPFVRALRKHLEINDESDRGVRTMKEQMLLSLNRRYAQAESNEPLVLATLLDPCFKDKCFSNAANRTRAKNMLEDKVKALDGSLEQTSSSDTTETGEPASKRPKTTSVVQCLSEILEESGVEVADSSSTIVEKYLADPLIPFHTGSSYRWWNENKLRFPSLAKLAQRYLSAPPTSVRSERLFSTAGNLYSDRRSRLAPERAEILLFIKSNFELIKGTYDY